MDNATDALRPYRLDYLMDLIPTDRFLYRPGLDRLATAVAHRRGGCVLECATTFWPRGLDQNLALLTAGAR